MTGFTPEALERLERAIGKGVLTVQFEDRRTTYRSLAEMLQVRDLMRSELNGSGGTARRRRRYAATDKGFC